MLSPKLVWSQMNDDYELSVTRAEACAMMRREFECVAPPPRSAMRALSVSVLPFWQLPFRGLLMIW